MTRKIGFVVPYIFPVLTNTPGPFGGAEIRAKKLAKILNENKIDVIFYTHESSIDTTNQKIRFLTRSYRDKKKFINKFYNKLLGFLFRNTLILPFGDMSECDSYACFGINDFALRMYAASLLAGKKFYLFITSDICLTDELEKSLRKDFFFDIRTKKIKFLEGCTHIVVQNQKQLQIAESYGLKNVTLLSNPIDNLNVSTQTSLAERSYFLWVGKNNVAKQADLYIQLANSQPQCNFVMILNDAPTTERVEDIYTIPKNLKIFRGLKHSDMTDMYQHAIALVNTSGFEGMPNAFLESFNEGTPVLSLNVDPNQCLSRYNAGVCFRGDLNLLGQNVTRIKTDSEFWRKLSSNCFVYLQKVHSPTEISQNLMKIIN